MPWQTPTLKRTRELTRDYVLSQLGAVAMIPNSVLRIMSDAMAGLAHLTLVYIDWLARQLLPDTAETEWLDRHGRIWLTNADGSKGRKAAAHAAGQAGINGTPGITVPVGMVLGNVSGIEYQTVEEIVLSSAGDTPVAIMATTGGPEGNMEAGERLQVDQPPAGIDGAAVVIQLSGGTDEETDEQLRQRVLQRIQEPPQGGAAHDYVRWALAVPGCTRAWCAPNEMGIGTVTVRVLFDDVRASDDGWPQYVDLKQVEAYIDTQRPVAVKDFWVLAPIKHMVEVHIRNLTPDNDATRAAIEESLKDMMFRKAAPGQTIFATWKAQAVSNAADVVSFDLLNWNDDVMESPGHMGVLGDIVYG